MGDSIRERTEARERATLSAFAALSAESEGRLTEEEPDPIRTAFQRDRDRILHSKAFRRLKHKTQVFIDPAGDHYRTRLTHTLEVAQIARTIGRALLLNEDLIEAIALGHDVGHTPFGHAGERAMDDALKDYARAHKIPLDEAQDELELSHAPGKTPTRFRHYEQSLRIVDTLEPLNLSQETRRGIGGHSKGRKDLTESDGEPVSTLEAAVVRVSDRIAYLSHDIDDAIRSGLISEIPAEFAELGTRSSKRIGTLVHDVIEQSLDRPRVALSPRLRARMNSLKEWMFENVYLRYPVVFPDVERAEDLVRGLFEHYAQVGNLPDGYRGIQGAVDYVAGMTDRFAISKYTELKLPSNWHVR